MNALKYCEIACSKDERRYNLTSVYRDVDCFVATDGDRLHLVSGQPKIDKGHYINGLDAEFPEYHQVLPKQSTEFIVGLIIGDKKHGKRLIDKIKAFNKLISLDSGDKITACWLIAEGNKLILEYDTLRLELDELENFKNATFKLGLNLKFFADALSLDYDYMKREVHLEYYGDLALFLVKSTISGYDSTAVITPMRM